MKMAKCTKRLRYAKSGDVVIVHMGMIFPHAVKLEKVYTDEDGQIVGDGHFVEMEGCSMWRVNSPCHNQKVGVCLGYKKA